MKIILIPQRREDDLAIRKAGSVLNINGEDFDFSPMTEGSTLPRTAVSSEWFAGDVEMQDGELVLSLYLPNPVNYSPAQAFPEPLLNVPDGLVALPQPLPAPDSEELMPL